MNDDLIKNKKLFESLVKENNSQSEPFILEAADEDAVNESKNILENNPTKVTLFMRWEHGESKQITAPIGVFYTTGLMMDKFHNGTGEDPLPDFLQKYPKLSKLCDFLYSCDDGFDSNRSYFKALTAVAKGASAKEFSPSDISIQAFGKTPAEAKKEVMMSVKRGKEEWFY